MLKERMTINARPTLADILLPGRILAGSLFIYTSGGFNLDNKSGSKVRSLIPKVLFPPKPFLSGAVASHSSSSFTESSLLFWNLKTIAPTFPESGVECKVGASDSMASEGFLPPKAPFIMPELKHLKNDPVPRIITSSTLGYPETENTPSLMLATNSINSPSRKIKEAAPPPTTTYNVSSCNTARPISTSSHEENSCITLLAELFRRFKTGSFSSPKYSS